MARISRVIKKDLILLLITVIILFTSISNLQNLQDLNSTDEKKKVSDISIKSSDWDADGWMYRRKIILTPATPELDYQIRVDLNPSNFNYSQAKSDGSDIRFYNLNRNLLDYWIELWNPTGNSIIWVKISTAGTSIIYIYYGNPTAFSFSNGTSTFIFFDDFEAASLDPLKWDTEIGSYCGISVSSGYVRVYSATPSAFVIFTEVGFTDLEGVQGVPYSGYYTNGHAMTRLSTDTTWFTGEIRILNSTDAPFYKNDVFDSADTSTRTGPLPARFFSHSCEDVTGHPYWAYISSIDTSLGVSGRAVRFESWVNLVGSADFRMDWVFVFKFNKSNPNIIIGSEENFLTKKEWKYRRELTLNPSTPELDYQIRVDLNPSIFNYSQAKSDGGDIRFYDLSNNLLDYWIESWNPSGNSIIWVEIPTPGTSAIYMYYGNPTAFSWSNGLNTFIFFDDFEGASLDLLKWDTEIGSYCGISVSNGYVRVYSATPSAFAIFVEVGFTDLEGVQGVPFSGYYTNGHAMVWPSTDTTWFTGQIRILNSTYAPFHKNDLFDSADTSTRTGPLPARFFSHSCVDGSGAPYWAYISSIDTSLGVPGRAVRFEGWVDLVGIADFRMDWVFVFKFNESNPTVNIGEEVSIYNRAPEIIINKPITGESFNNLSPFFDISVIDINLNTTWYTIDNGETNITFHELTGIINQTKWNSLPEGPVTIKFYANNSWGYLGSTDVIVIKDLTNLVLNINSPYPNQHFGVTAPSFQISVDEMNPYKTWYTLDDGLTNITFSGLTGTINQTEWDDLPEGPVTIIFYINDTSGKLSYDNVVINKDITMPILTIYEPLMNEEFGYNSPIFNISIDESNFDIAWYTIDDGLTNYTILGNVEAIDQVAWNNATYGNITISFYAKDKAGNEGYNQVIVIKKKPSRDDLMIPGTNLYIISLIFFVAVISLAWRFKKIIK